MAALRVFERIYMKQAAMMEMSSEDIDLYAKVIGTDTTTLKTKKAKVEKVLEHRERRADIDLLGITVAVPIKNLHDKRVSDLVNSPTRSDASLEKAMTLILGDEQMDRLMAAATDDDGLVDNDALGFAFTKLITSDELKNY